MYKRYYIVLIYLICICFSLTAQKDNTPRSEVKPNRGNSIFKAGIPKDSSTLNQKPISRDTTPKVNSNILDQIKISEDAPPENVEYGAQDTQWLEAKEKKMHLYGNAFVHYQDKKLNAAYIIFDLKNNTAEAFRYAPHIGKTSEIPTFSDGDKTYRYNQIKYNFKTSKGIVYEAISQEGDLYLHGAKTKYISSENDSITNNDVIYNVNSLITTCTNPDHPHFGIRARKLKVIPDKVVILGASNVEIAGVKTPIVLPFGFYPLTKGSSTGFIFPQDFDYSAERGLGIRGFGWYFPINDYMDVTLLANFYTRLTHGVNINTRYKRRYKYNGSIDLGYNNNISESPIDATKLSDKSFSLNVRHNQDSKAHPYIKIGGNISMNTNGFNAATNNNAQSQLSQTYTSNFSFSHSMPNTPFNFSLGLSHRQNTATHSFDVTLPEIRLGMNTIYPFKSKTRISKKEKWYEKINFKYTGESKNFIEATDTTLFTQKTLDDMRSGISHAVNTGISFKVFKHFNLAANANYDEDWVFKTVDKTQLIELDTTSVDTFFSAVDTTLQFNTRSSSTIESAYNNGFKAYRDYGASISLNTQLFGTIPSAKGWFRGIRHTMKPNIGLNFSPDTEKRYEKGYYDEINDEIVNYSPFERSAVSIPGLSGKRMSLTYGISNVLEMKYFSKKDTTDKKKQFKKFKILERLNLNGNYNFAADSLQWSPITVSGNTRILNGKTKITLNFSFDPYAENELGRRVNQFNKDVNEGLLRFDSGNVRVSTSFSFREIFDILLGKDGKSSGGIGSGPIQSDERRDKKDDKESKGPSSLRDYLKNLSLTHDLNFRFDPSDDDLELINVHSIRLSGRIPMTENWSLNLGNLSYDFTKKDLTYPSFGFSRKLHCWNLDFSWFPSNESYSFFVGVSSSTLNFLKYNYGQNQLGGAFNGSRANSLF